MLNQSINRSTNGTHPCPVLETGLLLQD